MNIKVNVPRTAPQTLVNSRIKTYGQDGYKSIRNSYELSTLISKYCILPIEHLISAAKTGSKDISLNTCYNLNQTTVQTLNILTQKTKLSRAELIRAVIELRRAELEENISPFGDSDTAIETLSQVSPIGKIEDYISRTSNPVRKNDMYHPLISIFRAWAEENPPSLEKSTGDLAALYSKLGWGHESYYDIIASLYHPILIYGAVMNTNGCADDRPLFRFNSSGNVEMDVAGKRESEHYISDIRKDYLVKNYLDNIDGILPHLGNRSSDKRAYFESLLADKSLREFAENVYTLPNYYPVPDAIFNAVKGLVFFDQLPVILAHIEKCMHICSEIAPVLEKLNAAISKEGLNTTITYNTIAYWHCFFAENRESLLLQDWYAVDGTKIIPRFLFSGQSLSHPLPTTAAELNEYIDNLITRYFSRKYRIITKLVTNPSKCID